MILNIYAKIIIVVESRLYGYTSWDIQADVAVKDTKIPAVKTFACFKFSATVSHFFILLLTPKALLLYSDDKRQFLLCGFDEANGEQSTLMAK